MHLYHEAVEAEVEGCLGEVEEGFAASGDVAGVAEDGYVGHGAAELYGYLPDGVVAVAGIAEDVESAVDGCHVGDACLAEALDGANPELDVGAGGVFDEDLYGGATEGLGDFLDHEGVGGGAGADPYGADAVAECGFDMVGEDDFAAEGECLFVAHPFEGLLAQAFEAAGACAGLPDAAAYHGDFGHGGEAAHHVVELLAAFHAAGAGDEDGLFLVHGCSNASFSVLLCGAGEKVAACVCGGVAGTGAGGGFVGGWGWFLGRRYGGGMAEDGEMRVWEAGMKR